MSGIPVKSSNIHGFMVSRKYSIQPQKTWQGSTTAPELHTKQAKPTVNIAYLLIVSPTLTKTMLQISVQKCWKEGNEIYTESGSLH